MAFVLYFPVVIVHCLLFAMLDFDFQRQSQILFGSSRESETGALIKYQGGRRVLLVSGQNSARLNGVIEKIKRSLDRAGLDCMELAGVTSATQLARVHEGIRLCREQYADFVLAAGGTTVINCAKAISAGFYYDHDVMELFAGDRKNLYRTLPMGVVLTTFGSGTEYSGTCTLTKYDAMQHIHLLEASYPIMTPQFTVLNPELTASLDGIHTACNSTELIAAVLSSYFTNTRGVDFTDRLCEAALHSVLDQTGELLRDSSNHDARANLMQAAFLIHTGILSSGRQRDEALDKLSLGMVTRFRIPRGKALAVLLPAWLTFITQRNLLRMAQFAGRVLGVPVNFDDPEVSAFAGIARLRLELQQWGMPQNFADLNIDHTDIPQLLSCISFAEDDTIGQYVKLDKDACEAVYYLAASRHLQL